jgi:hypothetical protein
MAHSGDHGVMNLAGSGCDDNLNKEINARLADPGVTAHAG